MRHAPTLLAISLACAACSPKKAAPADSGSVDAARSEPAPTPAAVDAPVPPPPAFTSRPASTVAGRKMPYAPRLAWTGTAFALLWAEVETSDEPPDDPSTDEYEVMDLYALDTFEIRFALVDPASGVISQPVTLEGAGSGPKALAGPVFSMPAWFEGTVALGWVLWNDTVETGRPARYIMGRWRPDGTAVGKPVIAAKDPMHHMYYDVPDLHLVAIGPTLYLAWASETRKSGCRCDCGDLDSVAVASMDAAGSVGVEYVCADVMSGLDVGRFGGSLVVIMHNEHVGYHTWIHCIPASDGCYGEYWESTNPLTRMIATGSGFAVWYDTLDEETFEVAGHCLDIAVAGGTNVECARYGKHRLEWGAGGLGLTFETKDGESITLPFVPGDHVSPGLVRKALVDRAPVLDAVLGDGSLAIAWAKGDGIAVRVIGPDGLR